METTTSSTLVRTTHQAVIGALKAHGVEYVERYRGKRNGKTVRAGVEVMAIGKLVCVEYRSKPGTDLAQVRSDREAAMAGAAEALEAAGMVYKMQAGALVVGARKVA